MKNTLQKRILRNQILCYDYNEEFRDKFETYPNI